VIVHDPKIGVEGIIIKVPFIPPDIIPDILSTLSLPKEEYFLTVLGFTTIILFSAWILYRKNLF
jgi:hypothetical protein